MKLATAISALAFAALCGVAHAEGLSVAQSGETFTADISNNVSGDWWLVGAAPEPNRVSPATNPVDVLLCNASGGSIGHYAIAFADQTGRPTPSPHLAPADLPTWQCVVLKNVEALLLSSTNPQWIAHALVRERR